MRNYFADKYLRLIDLCESHRKATLISSLGMGVLTLGILGLNFPDLSTYWYYPALYVTAIVLPIILGMAGKIDFKWVLLWEAIILLPFALVLVLVLLGLFLQNR